MSIRKICLLLCITAWASVSAMPMRTRIAQAGIPAPEGETDMFQLAANLQPGWNLGNAMDATGGETSWGNPVTTREMIDAIAAAGFKSMRLPVTWSFRSGPGPDYVIPEAAMTRVQEIADWALDAGMYVVLNLHHDTEWIKRMGDAHDETLARFQAYWRQIAAAFADYPANRLLFESINEPRFSDDWNKNAPEYFVMLDELNTAFYEIVRNSGGHNDIRPLVLPTVTCSSEQTRMDELYQTIQKLNDPYLFATVHYYGHYHFSVNVGGVTTFNNAVRADIDHMLNRCDKTFLQNDIPVLIGEYGLLAFDRDANGVEHGELLKYFDYLTYAARSLHIPLFLWDNGNVFNRRTLTWHDPSIINTVLHNQAGRCSLAERDVIFLKKQTLITDTNIKLELNGNELTGVYLCPPGEGGDSPQAKALAEGSDYRLADAILTITSDFLLTLPSAPLGEAGVLYCRFSAGPDWAIRIKQYDTPTLKAAANVGSSLKIPAAFNGDELSTMEAYAFENGRTTGNAGPDNWTPYQQISRSFAASYTDEIITLTTDFIKSLNDGDYLLRFHFLSGEKLAYYLTKNGISLLGNPETENTSGEQAVPGAATPAQPDTPAAIEPPVTAAPSDRNMAADKLPEAAETAAPSDEGHWLSRAWQKPAVKIGAGALAAIAVAATAFGASLWRGVKGRKQK